MASLTDVPVRTATLEPRRVGDYVPTWTRLALLPFLALVIDAARTPALSVRGQPGMVALGIAATIVGTPGCALALSTGVQRRYLEAMH